MAAKDKDLKAALEAKGGMGQVSRMTASAAGTGTVKAFFESNRAAVLGVLPKHMTAERIMGLAVGAMRETPKLMQCNVASLFGATIKCAQLGLEPNTPLGHAYLIPFDRKEKRGGEWVVVETNVQVIIGYKGMLDLARRSGQINSISAREVCENDEFNYQYGLREDLTHKPAMRQRGEVIGFYAVAHLNGGGHQFEFMSREQVEEIRDNSQGYKAALSAAKRYNKTPDTPWETAFVEMGKKTALRRLFKYLPVSIEMLASAMELEDSERTGVNHGEVITGEYSTVEDSTALLPESAGGEPLEPPTTEQHHPDPVESIPASRQQEAPRQYDLA